VKTLELFLVGSAVAFSIGAGLGWVILQAVALALRIAPHIITVVR
jgi:hypothetical protein